MALLHNHYRPKKLADVCGQDHLVRVLKSASLSGRLGEYQAVLFTGNQGCGKTSLARWMAFALNCTNKQGADPCYKCDACKQVEFSLEHGGDIVEMDAASKSGKEDIAAIIESCQYNPIGSVSRRVYIIDEAHQLSNAAKDALLKTLEEPPRNVHFILATTEWQRMPPTISSRCVPMPVRDGDPVSIARYLKQVLRREGVDFDEPALNRLGYLARGSYRDALGLVEKIIDVSTSVTMKSIDDVLCLPDSSVITNTVRAVVSGDQAKCVSLATDVLAQGKDMRAYLEEVVNTIMRGAMSLSEKNMAASPEGLTVSDLFDISQQIAEKYTNYPGVVSGMIPGLILAGAASRAAQKRGG